MAEVNEAWRVLSDPGRRATYDASLRPPARPVPGPARADEDVAVRYAVPHGAYETRRGGLPWGWLVMVVVMAAIFILTAGALADGPDQPPTDGLLRPGECVVIDTNLDAVEVPCSDPHDGVVDQLVTSDTACPITTEEHRDRQGLGKVCVIPS